MCAGDSPVGFRVEATSRASSRRARWPSARKKSVASWTGATRAVNSRGVRHRIALDGVGRLVCLVARGLKVGVGPPPAPLEQPVTKRSKTVNKSRCKRVGCLEYLQAGIVSQAGRKVKAGELDTVSPSQTFLQRHYCPTCRRASARAASTLCPSLIACTNASKKDGPRALRSIIASPCP